MWAILTESLKKKSSLKEWFAQKVGMTYISCPFKYFRAKIFLLQIWFTMNNPWLIPDLLNNFKITRYFQVFLLCGMLVELINRVKCLLQAFWRVEGSASGEHGSSLQELSSSPRSSYSQKAVGRQSPLRFSVAKK